MPRYTVTWTEITTYRHTFELAEPVDLDDYSDIFEALDGQLAWDRVDWAQDLIEVADRTIDDVIDDGNAPPVDTHPQRYRAEFSPQAWQGLQAVPVDPLGPTEWDATGFIVSALSDEWEEWARETIARGSDHEDVLRQDPAAPEWVREWAGPFDTYLRAEVS